MPIFCKNYLDNYSKLATYNIKNHIAENYIWIFVIEEIDKTEPFANLIIVEGTCASLKYQYPIYLQFLYKIIKSNKLQMYCSF